MENKRNYQLLDQFSGRKCEVSLHTLVGNFVISTYIHHSFFYELDNENIYLKDGMNNQNDIFTELNSITEVKNLCDDIYHDVVDLVIDNFIISVCLLEEKPKYPKCHKCGNEICIPEDNWYINGYDGYENIYDGDVELISSLHFCSNCITEFIGEIPCNEPDWFGGEYHE